MVVLDTAIILAGGLGTRLRPLTEAIPKPLVPIHGKPILEHTIKQLSKHGVKNIIISVGYKAQQIMECFGDGSRWKLKISYIVESEPLGTGGAVKKAALGLQKSFLLVWGDNLMDVNYSQMKKEFYENHATIMMALTHREDVENFGVAKLEKNKIVAFIEKPKRGDAPSTFINAGAFVLDPSCLRILPEGRSSIEKDCFEKLALLGEISAFIHSGQWFPTDTLEKYYHANAYFRPDIDLKEKKVIIADVDDTVCDSCQQISPEMAEQISRLIQKGYEFAFISGTKIDDLLKMISSRVKGKHHILATTGTHYALVENDKAEVKYALLFSEEEKKEIMLAFEKLIAHFDLRPATSKEDQLQDRGSQITLSAIGRNAPLELKMKYDPDASKRKAGVEFLKQYLDETKYNLKIGGTTSIDVTRGGSDKEQGIRKFAEHNAFPLDSILFIGDKIFLGGNDFPATKIVDCISVKSPHDTLKELRKIEILNEIMDVEKPWGNFERFTCNAPSTVKILEIEPNNRLSLQSHQHRDELWVMLDEGATVEIGDLKSALNRGEKIFVPRGVKHRIYSANNKVRVLEISFGIFNENDIIRYEDDFGRIQKR